MNKKIIQGVILCINICIFCACGNQSTEYTEVQNTKTSTAQSESANADTEDNNTVVSLPSYVPGLYLGENGSGLIIYNEGKADYYWYEWDTVESGNVWSYKDNKLTIYIPSCDCDVYAEIPEEVTPTLVFKSDSNNWDDESYTKISSVQSKLLPDDFDKLLEQNGIIVSSESFKEYEIGKIKFSFPENYMYEVVNDSSEEYIFGVMDESNETDASIIRTYSEDLDNDDDTFYENVDKYVDVMLKKIASDMTLIKSENTIVANQSAKRYIYSLVKEDSELKVDTIAINNVNDKKFVLLINIIAGESGSDNSIKYGSEFEAILDSAIIEGTETNVENTEAEENVSTDDVTPELKEFLDEYEAFINEYVDFMKKYTSASSNDVISMLSDYTDILTRYSEFAEAIDKYDTNTMSTADAAYYLAVTNRCTKKMLELY